MPKCTCKRVGDFWQSAGCQVHRPEDSDGPVNLSELRVMEPDLAQLLILLHKIDWLEHTNGGIVITQKDFDRLQKLMERIEANYE